MLNLRALILKIVELKLLSILDKSHHSRTVPLLEWNQKHKAWMKATTKQKSAIRFNYELNLIGFFLFFRMPARGKISNLLLFLLLTFFSRLITKLTLNDDNWMIFFYLQTAVKVTSAHCVKSVVRVQRIRRKRRLWWIGIRAIEQTIA